MSKSLNRREFIVGLFAVPCIALYATSAYYSLNNKVASNLNSEEYLISFLADRINAEPELIGKIEKKKNAIVGNVEDFASIQDYQQSITEDFLNFDFYIINGVSFSLTELIFYYTKITKLS